MGSRRRTGSEGPERKNLRAEDPLWQDRDLLAGVRGRDSDALARFFDLAFPYVFTLALRLTRNKERAEDITQEVFLKIYRATDRLETDVSAKPWVTTITYNAFRDETRRLAARPEELVDPIIMTTHSTDTGTPETELIRREREQMVERALQDLDEESRAVVILHDYCERPHEEIATLMGISHAAVRKRHSRALKRMTEFIRGEQK